MTNRVEDDEAVRACIQKYIDGAGKGDVDLLKQAFHPDAQMYGHMMGGEMAGSVQAFYDHVASSDAPDAEKYHASIVSVEVSGSVAHARLHEDNYQGFDFVDHFLLFKDTTGWRIVTKTFAHDERS